MNKYDLSQLSDEELMRGLEAAAARERSHTAELLADLAEIDARKAYADTHSSIEAWCLSELNMDEDDLDTYIAAARVGHRFPEFIRAIGDGRLNPWSVVMLSPYLTNENAQDLLAAAANKTETEIERLLAKRFPPAESA